MGAAGGTEEVEERRGRSTLSYAKSGASRIADPVIPAGRDRPRPPTSREGCTGETQTEIYREKESEKLDRNLSVARATVVLMMSSPAEQAQSTRNARAHRLTQQQQRGDPGQLDQSIPVQQHSADVGEREALIDDSQHVGNPDESILEEPVAETLAQQQRGDPGQLDQSVPVQQHTAERGEREALTDDSQHVGNPDDADEPIPEEPVAVTLLQVAKRRSWKNSAAIACIATAQSKVWAEKVCPALHIYHQTHNQRLDVPPGFMVPQEAPWPKASWGRALGNDVSDILRTGKFVNAPTGTEAFAWLNSHGFDWTTPDQPYIYGSNRRHKKGTVGLMITITIGVVCWFALSGQDSNMAYVQKFYSSTIQNRGATQPNFGKAVREGRR